MSTLLDLKSSVLRQVQRSQSLRARREPPSPTTTTASSSSSNVIGGGPSMKASGPAPLPGVAEGRGFFTRMNDILLKQERMLDAGQTQHKGVSLLSPPPAEPSGGAFLTERTSREELDLLYEEAVYTIMNQTGVPCQDHVTDPLEIFGYLQRVFEIGPEEHDIILQRVNESKKASFSLRVSVMKARNLMAKDANGYSDPYCMMGVLVKQSQRESEERRERRFSFRKRRERPEKTTVAKESIAARCIQATEVKPETLNPVWNEHFVFDVDDVQNELLHLDIWDHDDDVSVAEACRKLNEISGIRGMGRYFKQIAKSVRANGATASGGDENADDFLGCLNISMSDIPVVGYNQWFKLEPRSTASKVQGDIQLVLRLFTRQRDTALSGTESSLSIHRKMLSQILDHEHASLQVEPYNWNGRVSAPARTVISHHAMQADLSSLQQAIIHWTCYSAHHRARRMCYSSILGLLKTISAEWDPSAVCGELETLFTESLRLHSDYCVFLIRHLRQVFPSSHPVALTRCELMLRGLGYMQTMEAFQRVFPLHHAIQLELTSAIKKGTIEWFEKMIVQVKLEEGVLEEELKLLVEVVDDVCADVQEAHSVYNRLFHSTVRVDFFSVSYRQLDKLVADHVSVLMEKVCGTLEQENSRLSQTMGEILFELYISLKTLRSYREHLPLRETKMLALNGSHNWFKSSIHKWLQIVHEQSCERIRRAVETDQFEPAQQKAKRSSSAADVLRCFGQVQELWAQLAWPDSAGAFIFITRLTDNLCSEAVYYSELLKRKIERAQHHKNVIVQLCIALNNIDHVHAYLSGLPGELNWRRLEKAMEESCGPEGREQVVKSLNGQLLNADADLQRESRHLVAHLTEKMLVEFKKCIQHISLSPDSIQNEDAVSPLMKYLTDIFIVLSEALVSQNLDRVLSTLWEMLLRLILDTVVENRGVQVEFYSRFQYTLEVLLQFFHTEGEGIPLEELKSEDYKAIEEELRLNKCSSFQLIEQYFLEKIMQQRILKHSKFGRISVKCYYDAPEQRLTVEILHASDLIALDANGLSDPFVIVELNPHHLFPFSKSQRTQVKQKTLHPVFDELFYFHVKPEQYRHRFACLSFTVMDYDWLSTNDFAGDAVAPLSDFCWPGRPNVSSSSSSSSAGKDLQPHILHLSRQKPSEKPIVKMLDARTGDRDAQEFVKKLKEITRCMDEE